MLAQMFPQPLRADELALARTAQVEEEVLADVGGEGGQLGGSMVAEEAGEGALRPVHQQVALALQLVLEAAVAGGAVVEKLPEALAGL